jgi:thymidylate synthase
MSDIRNNSVVGNTVSQTVLQGFDRIINDGDYRESRNGGCTSIFDTTFEMTNPRSRHLWLEGRKSNIFALIAETFWVMAGDDKVNPYLSFFLPRAPDYSDDGVAWHGAYGPRFYRFSQHLDALAAFTEDGLYTRRSFIQISMPDLDNKKAIEARYGIGHKARDVPCNREIHFYVDGQDKFCAKTLQRSGDMIFGTGSINPFEFSFLHELMYNEVHKVYPDLEIGSYRWHVTNAHLYDFSKSQAEAAYNSNTNYVKLDENHDPIIACDINLWQDFFGELVKLYTEAIVSNVDDGESDAVCGTLISHIGYAFLIYGVPREGNLLWTYAKLVAHYIAEKKKVPMLFEVDISEHSDEFKNSILNSSFKKFEVIA